MSDYDLLAERLISSLAAWRAEGESALASQLAEYNSVISDGSLTTHAEHMDILRDMVAAYENEIGLIERLEKAEHGLISKGYRKSCEIPACNCGSNADARLREIADATRDHWRDGELLLTRIERIVAAAESAPGHLM